MKYLIALIIVCLSIMWTTAKADDSCLAVADIALAAADAGRQGTGLTEIFQGVDQANIKEDEKVSLRRMVIYWYTMGTQGRTMYDVWETVYQNCKGPQGKQKVPA